MADSKSAYSEASKYYVEVRVPSSDFEKSRYARNKAREAEFGKNWEKRKVNLNEIVDQFCPDYTVKERAYKFIFKGDRYDVSADMGTGYARIRDKVLSSWVTIEGTPSQNREETHFKIKKREEM